MRIGIDCRMINESGIGRYLRNLIKNLQKIDSENEYFLFLRKRDLGLKLAKNFHAVEADFKWYGVEEQLRFPKILNPLELDLIHFPHFNIPVFYKGKFIVTIHDLLHQHFQMKRSTTLDPLTYKIKTKAYNFAFKEAVKKAEKIIVPTNFVKEQLIAEWGITPNKIVVTYEGVDDELIKIIKKMSQNDAEKILKELKVPKPYLFYIGNAHPHKQIELLIRSYLEIKKNRPELSLVLSGKDNYFWQRIKDQYSQPIYTDFITDLQMVALYKNAECFVMPSKEEGFGIPILEAFAASCPVLSSDAGALMEVGGEACIFFDSGDQSDLQNKVVSLLDNKRLRQQLVQRGVKRYKQFDWQKMARQTLDAYLS